MPTSNTAQLVPSLSDCLHAFDQFRAILEEKLNRSFVVRFLISVKFVMPVDQLAPIVIRGIFGPSNTT